MYDGLDLAPLLDRGTISADEYQRAFTAHRTWQENGRTLRHARASSHQYDLRIVARFRFWRQPIAARVRSVPRAGP